MATWKTLLEDKIKIHYFIVHNIIYILSKNPTVFENQNLSKNNFDNLRIQNKFTEMIFKKYIKTLDIACQEVLGLLKCDLAVTGSTQTKAGAG